MLESTLGSSLQLLQGAYEWARKLSFELLRLVKEQVAQAKPSAITLAAVKQALYLTALRLLQNEMDAIPLLQALGIRYTVHPHLLGGSTCQSPAFQPAAVHAPFMLRKCLAGKFVQAAILKCGSNISASPRRLEMRLMAVYRAQY